MALEIIAGLASAVFYCFGWFDAVMQKTGMVPLYSAMLGIAVCVAYLLHPILRSVGGSDRAGRPNRARSSRDPKSTGNTSGYSNRYHDDTTY